MTRTKPAVKPAASRFTPRLEENVAINQPPCAGPAQDRPSDCPVQPASADPAANSLKTTRRDFLRAGGMLSLSSLMGTAALMNDAEAQMQAGQGAA